MHRRVATTGILVGLLLSLALGPTASAFQVIKLTGHYGDFGTAPATADDTDHPGAKCGYSAAVGGFAYLAWIKVFPFKATAYDRTAEVDHQKVTFKVIVQRSNDGGTTWTKVGSASETRRAYDNLSANFDALKVYTTGKAGNLYRALVTLKWLRHGLTDGLAKVRMEYYGVKWTVGDPAYVYQDACDGRAD
jgi:hypothetical protein